MIKKAKKRFKEKDLLAYYVDCTTLSKITLKGLVRVLFSFL